MVCPDPDDTDRPGQIDISLDATEGGVMSEELPEWVKTIINLRISHLQESVEATDYDDNKYAWNFAIEELQDILSLRRQL